MDESLCLRVLDREVSPVEIVERKGIGHPDTICDALAENLSRNLCRWYMENAGTILHHNVDKALLRAGCANAVFGGGEVHEPIDIYLAGRAVAQVGDLKVPIAELAVEGSRQWLKDHMHALDPQQHVRIHCLVRQGSADLTELFERGRSGSIAMSNDTSFGVGYAPHTLLEQAVLDAGRALDRSTDDMQFKARGEDTKIMAIRREGNVDMTVACAMIAPLIEDPCAYNRLCHDVAAEVHGIVGRNGFSGVNVTVNAADNPARDSYYLTVTGTSGEAGDDGQVGRGNRINGLITPFRAMSLEAVCGKNPVNHVGKLYNVAAGQIAHRLVDECPAISAAQCCLVSQIGRAITEPAVIDIAISTADASPVSEQRQVANDIISDVLAGLPLLQERFVAGEIQHY